MYQYTITPKDIYGKEVEELYIPPAYRVVGFRVPVRDDYFISKAGTVEKCVLGAFHSSEPRLIVAPKPKRKVVTFTETGEVRQVKQGEFFLNREFKFEEWGQSRPRPTMGSYPIYTRTESEI